MAELAQALGALQGGKTSGPTSPVGTPQAISPSALVPGRERWIVPPHLLRLPAVRSWAFTAHDCSKLAALHPGDFDKVYRYGLSLQELASRLSQQPADQLSLLYQAAEVYLEACHLQNRHAAALYNWAVALTDIARLVRAQQPDEAYECLTAAASKYNQSLAVQPDNPQANNNLGLVLQDLSAMSANRTMAARTAYLRHSLQKFRRAIRLSPDFDRACYNLGTVLYSHACSLQEALLASQEAEEAAAAEAAAAGRRSSDSFGGSKRGGSVGMGASTPRAAAPGGAAGGSGRAAAERTIQATFAHAAQYIALAYAMQPGRAVYTDSLQAVQRLLPLPHLRAGPLLAVHPRTADTPAEQWVSCWFGLGANGLQAVRPPAAVVGQGGMPSAPLPLGYELSDIADARLCCDPSLPEGAGIWISLHSKPRGVYLVAGEQEEAEGWVDALLLASHLVRRGGIDGLQAALSVRR